MLGLLFSSGVAQVFRLFETATEALFGSPTLSDQSTDTLFRHLKESIQAGRVSIPQFSDALSCLSLKVKNFKLSPYLYDDLLEQLQTLLAEQSPEFQDTLKPVLEASQQQLRNTLLEDPFMAQRWFREECEAVLKDFSLDFVASAECEQYLRFYLPFIDHRVYKKALESICLEFEMRLASQYVSRRIEARPIEEGEQLLQQETDFEAWTGSLLELASERATVPNFKYHWRALFAQYLAPLIQGLSAGDFNELKLIKVLSQLEDEVRNFRLSPFTFYAFLNHLVEQVKANTAEGYESDKTEWLDIVSVFAEDQLRDLATHRLYAENQFLSDYEALINKASPQLLCSPLVRQWFEFYSAFVDPVIYVNTLQAFGARFFSTHFEGADPKPFVRVWLREQVRNAGKLSQRAKRHTVVPKVTRPKSAEKALVKKKKVPSLRTASLGEVAAHFIRSAAEFAYSHPIQTALFAVFASGQVVGALAADTTNPLALVPRRLDSLESATIAAAFGGSDSDQFGAIGSFTNGSYVTFGQTTGFDSEGGGDPVVAWWSSEGELEKALVLRGSNPEDIVGLAMNGDDAYAVGTANGASLVLRFNSEGELTWGKRLTGGGGGKGIA